VKDFSIDRRRFFQFAGAASAAGMGWCLGRGRAVAAPLRSAHERHVVVLDPGHGGIDPGCIGCRGTYEKDITLDTARELARLLEESGRYRVKLTRNDDSFVALEDRVAQARADEAALLLSIHADALPDEHLRGASVYTLSEKASDREAAALAARENGADLVAGVDLSRHAPVVSHILFDLARRETNNQSIRLAQDLVSELGQRVRLLDHTHRSAGFVVLKAPDVPSALVEIGCLSNRDEEELLRAAAHRRVVANGLLHSIDDFFAARSA
jgi:N-acetylmuramoyl-L-alanine amidase